MSQYHKNVRRENDEVVCMDCHRRWDDNEDAPECVSIKAKKDNIQPEVKGEKSSLLIHQEGILDKVKNGPDTIAVVIDRTACEPEFTNDTLNYVLLAEELAELTIDAQKLIQQVSKLARFGPVVGPENKSGLSGLDLFIKEQGDVLGVLKIINKRLGIKQEDLQQASRAKLAKLRSNNGRYYKLHGDLDA